MRTSIGRPERRGPPGMRTRRAPRRASAARRHPDPVRLAVLTDARGPGANAGGGARMHWEDSPPRQAILFGAALGFPGSPTLFRVAIPRVAEGDPLPEAFAACRGQD